MKVKVPWVLNSFSQRRSNDDICEISISSSLWFCSQVNWILRKAIFCNLLMVSKNLVIVVLYERKFLNLNIAKNDRKVKEAK
jgi:hypothetical protein